MIFSSIDYFIFFIVIISLMMIIRPNSVKKGILLFSSYFFYAYWDYRFVFLMFLMSIVNYYIGIKIEKSSYQADKKKWLIASVIFNLCILGFFKYFNFFIESANFFLDKVNFRLPLVEIILPVAISFITFEVMSYVIDIYRGSNKSAGNFWDLALLVAFFPHLIAGPILKPSHFLPQLDKDIIIKWKNVEYGVQIFLVGLVKKIVIADRLALFADPVFQDPSGYSNLTVWLAVIAYSIQIFCDFSGYSDMAIGSAKCFGFDIPANFNMPYISRSVTEFWRRWHISLSTWLKEYLYYSLGGNRKGEVRQYINLMLVMLLGGLWHGASWNFVIWGGLHGIALAIHKLWSTHVKNYFNTELFAYKFVSWLVTMVFICVTWVFFRSQDFATSGLIVQKMFYMINPEGIKWYATSIIAIIPFVIAAHYIGARLNRYAYFKLNTIKGLFILFFVILGLIFLQPLQSSPFIYFQF